MKCISAVIVLLLLLGRSSAAAEAMGPLPTQENLWGASDAERGVTQTRERIVLNGLWQFKPQGQSPDLSRAPEAGDFPYYFKVPGLWPTPQGWFEPDGAMIVYKPDGSEAGKGEFDGTKAKNAWYRRTVDIPANWQGRKIEVELTSIQAITLVYVNGKQAGGCYFPAGKVDITSLVKPGQRCELILYFSSEIPEKAVTSFNAPDRAEKSLKRNIARKGITGDVLLSAEPVGMRITDAHIITSVHKGTITFDVGFSGRTSGTYTLQAAVSEKGKLVKTFKSPVFSADGDRFSFAGEWRDAKLWDTDAPDHLYSVALTLTDAGGKVADELYPQEFGFREFRIVGKDFLLNGKRIHLRARTSQYFGAPYASSDDCLRSAQLHKAFGYNFLINGNYSFTEGDTGYLDMYCFENSRAGMLFSLTLPHPAMFDWKLNDPKVMGEYKQLAQYLVRRYQNVPGLVMYASAHNATGYECDQDPMLIDGKPEHVPATVDWRERFRNMALDAAAEIGKLDATRPVYQHESGALGAMYTINCYLNWAPVQERSDWFAHWQREGVMPLFLVEWGLPHKASWSSYRGPQFIWGGTGIQCAWLNEYNAQYLGEQAYRPSEMKQFLMRQHDSFVRGNRKVAYGGNLARFRYEPDFQNVLSIFSQRNIRDLRARGVSAFLPWDQEEDYWVRPGGPEEIARLRKLRADRFDGLKRAGVLKCDYTYGAFADQAEMPRTPTGELTSRLYQPQIGWIAGEIGNFTAYNTYYLRGETVKKSLVILNDSRSTGKTAYDFSVAELGIRKTGSVEIEAGGRADVPLEFVIPDSCQQKKLMLTARFTFNDGKTADDRFDITVGSGRKAQIQSPVALFDPEGKAGALLKKVGVNYTAVQKQPAAGGILVVGRGALGQLPFDLKKVADAGTKIVLLEQQATALENIGLRWNEHGMREAYALDKSFEHVPLNHWRGASTLLPEAIDPAYCAKVAQFPTRYWMGWKNRRHWRAGNIGTLCSVEIEKPAIGDFMPLVQTGFHLQYAPVLEYREPGKRVILCQLDISDRSENSPEALEALATVLEAADAPLPAKTRIVCYLGDGRGEEVLRKLKIAFKKIGNADECGAGDLLILGPGCGGAAVRDKVEAGLNVLALGLGAQEINVLMPGAGATEEHDIYPAYGDNLREVGAFRGVSNADLQWMFPFQKGPGLAVFNKKGKTGEIIKAVGAGKGTLAFCTLAPWMFDENELIQRHSLRRNYYLVARLAYNLGAGSDSRFLENLGRTGTPRDGFLPLYADRWRGRLDPKKEGKDSGWMRPDFMPGKEWQPVKVGEYFEPQSSAFVGDGWFWYRREFDFPALSEGRPVLVHVGEADDEAWVWLNGKLISDKPVAQNFPGTFVVPSADLKQKGNVLIILCNDKQYNGGLLGEPTLHWLADYRLYPDLPLAEDDPYRYYRW